MNNPYPTIGTNDTGALNADGSRALGVGAGAAVGLVLGKGKIVPTALGATLGYLLSHTDFWQKLTGLK